MRKGYWKADSYSGGAWAICDRCSQRWRRHQMHTEWDHLQVCGPCLDPRPPQMMPPDVYPEGIPFPDARPPQDNPDRLYDDSYLKAVSGGIVATDGVYPVYPNGQQAPLGAFSPQPVIVDPLPESTPLRDLVADAVTLRTGPVYAPSVTGPSPGPVPGSSAPEPPFYGA